MSIISQQSWKNIVNWKNTNIAMKMKNNKLKERRNLSEMTKQAFAYSSKKPIIRSFSELFCTMIECYTNIDYYIYRYYFIGAL